MRCVEEIREHEFRTALEWSCLRRNSFKERFGMHLSKSWHSYTMLFAPFDLRNQFKHCLAHKWVWKVDLRLHFPMAN